MVDILVRPPELRQISEQLKSSAKKIGTALQVIDNDILSLKGDQFLGNRANSVQAHYAPKREALLKAKEMVARFAEDLKTAANVFEKADNSNQDHVVTEDGKKLVPFIGINGESDIHPNDVAQGQIADCYFIAALGALSSQNPEAIRKLIHDNGDGTFTVTLYKKKLFGGYDEVRITVNHDDLTGDLPNNMSRAGFGDISGDSQEGWVMIIESAYAKWKGGYDDINWGNFWSPSSALEALTGKNTDTDGMFFASFDKLQKNFENGYAITASSHQSQDTDLYKSDQLVAQHVYYVTGVDKANQTVTVHNPYGWENAHEITLSFDEFKKNFGNVHYNSID